MIAAVASVRAMKKNPYYNVQRLCHTFNIGTLSIHIYKVKKKHLFITDSISRFGKCLYLQKAEKTTLMEHAECQLHGIDIITLETECMKEL